MSKHTPAPWTIARGSPPRVIASGKHDICEMLGASSNEGVMADASLIAAAPELLEALREVWAHSDKFNADRSITRTPEMQRMYLRAQAAIAKAEEQQ